jgi:hypothetical protein
VTVSNPEGAENRDPLSLTPPPQAPDPWGVKRAENLIASLTGILSARVVVTPLGEVSEIHVLTTSDQQAKQVVRNIESALMAQLGLKIDHRKISVAQTADVRPIEQMQEEAVRTRAKKRVVVFQGLEVRPSERPQRVIVRVKLSFEGREAEAEEQGTDTVRNRVEAAARAASTCLDRLRSRAPPSSRRSTAGSCWWRCTGWAGARRSCSRGRARSGKAPSGARCWRCWMQPTDGPTRGAEMALTRQ